LVDLRLAQGRFRANHSPNAQVEVNVMPMVFLSYSSKDRFFADTLGEKLSRTRVTLWRDQSRLSAGSEWRKEIEEGISNSAAVVVALSPSSSASSYVTFEWAYALGQGKVIIPVKLEECSIHPRLETMQYLDFSNSDDVCWENLIKRLDDIEPGTETEASEEVGAAESQPPQGDTYANAILTYLNQRGTQRASFAKLRGVISNALTDQDFNDIIVRNPTVFRHARIKKIGPGIAKLIP
jgi:hypothetical protein